MAIEDGRIREVSPDIAGGARGDRRSRTARAAGRHRRAPALQRTGRTEWEGAATGSRALAAGGGTLFFDMPLNSTPCTVNAREFDRKRAALEASSITDFGLWGGLVPGSVPDMAEMAERGVVGFKAFMCDSGLPEFPRADDVTLFDGLREAARLGRPVAVHAESEELTRGLAERITSRTARAFLDSRPVLAELEAIQRALLLAKEAQRQAAHRPCQLRPRCRARGRGASPGRRRVDRNLPSLSVFHRRGRGATGDGRQVRAAAARDRRAAGAVGRARARSRRHRRLRPFAGAAVDEERRFRRGVGRHRRRAVDAGRPARRGAVTSARLPARADGVAAGGRACTPLQHSPARARWPRAWTPTWRWWI